MRNSSKWGVAHRFRKSLLRNQPSQLIAFANSAVFKRLFPVFSILVLASSTVFWSILGARLQSGNADQLVDPRLFANSATLHNALLPGAHTFLIKWPIFYLIKLFGYSSWAFTFFTVGTVLVTVAGLVAIIYWIERRPLVFGLLCLALASVLLLVPPTPAAGAILPVNMAMLATRNLEYIVYIISLMLLIRSPGLRSRQFWVSTLLLGILIASDRLFFDLAIGGALLALITYALRKGWKLVSSSANWLVGAMLAAIGAVIILWLLNTSGLTHIASLSSSGPYGLLNGFHDLALGILYGILGVLTNFGANPAFDGTIVRNLPHDALSRLTGLGGLAFLANLAVLFFGLFAATRLVRSSIAYNNNRSRKNDLDYPAKLSLWLIWSSVAALVVFIFSSHYYAVDARYLTIALFALFVSMATYGRRFSWRPETYLLLSILLLISVGLATVLAARIYHQDKTALSGIETRDSLVAQVIKEHPVKALVGDYWRVIPIKQELGKTSTNVMPLQDCFSARQVLSSQAWQVNLNNNSFAYLLTLDRSLTNYPSCSLNKVIAEYGRPNTSALIAGTLSTPKEVLLFYDRGIHKSAPKPSLKTPSTILPITLDELPYTTCDSPTIFNVVAHQDDDLLFMNPDLVHDIKAGHCVRTVYVTAGDAGAGAFHWLSRQQGSEAAYSQMLGVSDIWVDRIVQLSNNEFITVSNPRSNSKISLIFMHLPDGNVEGQGFPVTHFESLQRLETGRINTMQAVDNQSSYTADQLVGALSSLMNIYGPTEIRTQSDFAGTKYTDHSDHMAVGEFVKKAYQRYETQQFENKVIIPISFYIGYPIHQFPQNVTGANLEEKRAAFYAYAGFDSGVCGSDQECSRNPAYNAYLTREYTNAY